MTTVAEKLTGKSAQHYIPIDKREENIKEHDPELWRYKVLEYVKQHDGEVIDQRKLAETLESSVFTIGYHLRYLVKAKRITAEKDGIKRRYFMGHRSTRANGPVQQKTPPAPVSRPQLSKTEQEAWEYVKTLADNSAEELGYKVKGVLGLLDHMRSKSPEVTLAPVEATSPAAKMLAE